MKNPQYIILGVVAVGLFIHYKSSQKKGKSMWANATGCGCNS